MKAPRTTIRRLSASIIAAVASLAVFSGPAEAATSIAVSDSTVKQGEALVVTVNTDESVKTCLLRLTGDKEKALGSVKVKGGVGGKTIKTSGIDPGTYQVQARCGKAAMATSTPFTVTRGSAATGSSDLRPSEIMFIKNYAGRVVRDIALLDEWTLDGIQAASELDYLATSFDGLVASKPPPGADVAKYYARAQTLANFARQAADYFDVGDLLNGQAAFAVLRAETVPLLQAINKGLGTTYALP